MPSIELIGEVREGIDTYSATVLSVMLFPLEDEAVERRNWHAASMANCYGIWKKSGASQAFLAPFHRWLDDLWKLPLSPEMIFNNGLKRSKRARLSGIILEYLLRLAQHHPEHCRVERSRALVREVLGSKAPSESLLEKTWADFKTVSHLWQARNMAAAVKKNIEDNADWLRLLSLAEECRRVAESLRLLPSGKTWRAPEGLPLEPVTLEIQPLAPDLLAFLNSQFPPR